MVSTCWNLAPHLGHVSNSWGSVDPLIEPADVYCFQSDSSAPPTLVQAGHPVWTGLELAEEVQGNFRMARGPRTDPIARRDIVGVSAPPVREKSEDAGKA